MCTGDIVHCEAHLTPASTTRSPWRPSGSPVRRGLVSRSRRCPTLAGRPIEPPSPLSPSPSPRHNIPDVATPNAVTSHRPGRCGDPSGGVATRGTVVATRGTVVATRGTVVPTRWTVVPTRWTVTATDPRRRPSRFGARPAHRGRSRAGQRAARTPLPSQSGWFGSVDAHPLDERVSVPNSGPATARRSRTVRMMMAVMN